MKNSSLPAYKLFLSTPSARRATIFPQRADIRARISIHALREEGDQNSIALIESGKRFLSTPSARRATLTLYHADVLRLISIHALREEGDAVSCSLVLMPCYFYPRPPRGGRQRVHPNGSRAAHFYPRPPRGGRLEEQVENNSTDVFLSTPSARRATLCRLRRRPTMSISIHALREEGDPLQQRFCRRAFEFLSTPSARRATRPQRQPARGYPISIHALREEGDSKNGEKHLRFCFIIKRSAQIWKSLSKNIRKRSCDLHRTA